ncbi:hypothetical protein [Deinococcus hopiensis]|uniref:hypothetical protein n=1 Tax=Deinococcus hopiensis TaxID=309885 RepID=UPI00111C52E1|nr:hypothetical protein [Deinococcus hopiensis]
MLVEVGSGARAHPQPFSVHEDLRRDLRRLPHGRGEDERAGNLREMWNGLHVSAATCGTLDSPPR